MFRLKNIKYILFLFIIFNISAVAKNNSKKSLNTIREEIVNKVASISKLECDISEQLLKVKKEILKIIEDLIAGNIVSKDRKELDLLYKQLQDLEEQFNLINNQLKNCTIKT